MHRRQFFLAPLFAAVWPADGAVSGRYPSVEEIGSRLQKLQEDHPRVLQLRETGRSVEGRPIWAVRATDPQVPDEDKERIIISALHTGMERSSAPAIISILKWLSSGERMAQDSLRRQIVTFLPLMNPDGYIRGTHANAKGMDIYTQWTTEGPQDPAAMPEAVVFQKILEKEQPEIHADIHGHSMEIEGYIHPETSGPAYSNMAVRPYRNAISALMNEAAQNEGYGSDLLEQDAERVFGGSGEIGMESRKFWLGLRTGAGSNQAGVSRVYAALYAYNRFHTMTLTSECAWERSAVLRHRRLLRIGNDVWPGEYYRGYPTRVILKNGFHQVCAYGETAAERRRSRVELWNMQGAFSTAVNNPQVEGKTLFACATTVGGGELLKARTLEKFSEVIQYHPAFESEPLRNFLRGFPTGPGQWGPVGMLHTEMYTSKAAAGPPRHGLSLRLRVPYPKAKNFEVRVNGKLTRQSPIDGYVAWASRGFTTVQVNLPPARTRNEDFFAVALQYDPGEKRTQNEDWK